MSFDTSVCPGGTAPAMSGASGIMLTTLIGSLLKGACDIGNPNNYPPDTSTSLTEFDFVIVGAGAGGSVLASRLTEAPHNFSVALLEAGGDPPADSDVPGLLQRQQRTEVDWQYKTEPQSNAFLGLKEQRCLWPRGRVLGGSTVLNAMIYVRGHKNDYNNWAAKGNTGWDYDSILPYFKRSENIQVSELKNSSFHSTGGPLPVSYFDEWPNMLQDLLQASADTGSRLTDVNGQEQSGFNRAQVTAQNSVRFNAAKAFLSQARDRTNLHIFKQSQATRVVFEGRKAVGVEFLRNGDKQIVKATKEVILAAGAIGSPQLLMLSGVGPAERLTKLEIPLVHDLKGVGQNLQDHPQFLAATFSVPREDTQLDMTFQYFKNRTGLLSYTGALSVNGFISTNYDQRDYPDVQMHFQGPMRSVEGFSYVTGLNEESQNTLFRHLKENRDVYLMSPVLLRPQSSGWLELQSADPLQHPKIFANYFSDSVDVKTLAAGAMWSLRMVHRLALTSQTVRLNTAKLPGCQQFNFFSSQYWECAVRHTTATTYHPAGTCKMGPEKDKDAVVDPELRVHGVQGLRVVDASIMPQIVSGNTMAPVYMIAEKAADLITRWWNKSEENNIVKKFVNRLSFG